MTLTNKLLTACMIFAFAGLNAQHTGYTYRRDISVISAQWHRILLPPELLGKTNASHSDIRVLGITATSDTIEAPYLLRKEMEQLSSVDVDYKLINTSFKGTTHYFTFEVPENTTVSEIKTEFAQLNFDWKVSIEGSHTQIEWFTITENYRILAIKNDQTNFQFTDISFAPANYRYLRMQVESAEKPELKSAKLSIKSLKEGEWNTYTVKDSSVSNNKVNRNTEIDIDLGIPVPVSRIIIEVAGTLDYYRNITISYLSDSTQTEKGMVYHYRSIMNSTLHSLQKNEFTFPGTIARKLRIDIFNGDNAPLEFSNFTVKGYQHELVVRFSDSAEYFLTYGNPQASAPKYDIARFADKIPTDLIALQLGAETKITAPESEGASELINKYWLWAVMVVIILLLGAFSLKLIRSGK